MSWDVVGCRGAMSSHCVVLWWCGICGFSDVVDLVRSRDVVGCRGMLWCVVLWCKICGFSEVVDLVRSRDVAGCCAMSRDVAGCCCRGVVVLWLIWDLWI